MRRGDGVMLSGNRGDLWDCGTVGQLPLTASGTSPGDAM